MELIPIEYHPLEPFLPEKATLLMLGTFPPQAKRWSMNFYYPNLQNDMWRIFGLIFFDNKEYFLKENRKAFNEELIRKFLTEKGIAIFDTGTGIRRLKDNASDKFLEITIPTDISALLKKLPLCKTIVTTGQKATDTFRLQIEVDEPKVGGYSIFNHHGKEMRLYRMPSSSRAYPLGIDKKAEIYRRMFVEAGLL